jgi:tetratricopeptide (TPR) repeat protein
MIGGRSLSRIAFAALFGALVLIAPHDAFAFGRAGCDHEPELNTSIKAEILACTSLFVSGEWAPRGPPTELKAAIYYDRGLLHHLAGEYSLAVDDYTRALGLMNGSNDALEARGDAYEDEGRDDLARVDYYQSSQYNGDGANGLNDRCWTRAIRGHPLDRALADCSRALQLSADDAQASILDSRCFVYFRMGNYPAAIADCDAALKKSPEFANSLYVRGLARKKSGDAGGGEADIATAKKLDSKIADLYALYGINP